MARQQAEEEKQMGDEGGGAEVVWLLALKKDHAC